MNYLILFLPGTHDIFLLKYDTSGNLLWTREMGTGQPDTSFGVATSSDGYVYISGGSGSSFNGQPYKGI